MAFFAADGDGNSGFFEGVVEDILAAEAGADPVESVDRVVGDEVDVGAEFVGDLGRVFRLGRGCR